MCQEGFVVRFVGGRYGLGPKLEELQRRLWHLVTPDPRVLSAFSHLHERLLGRPYLSLNSWYGSEIIVMRLFPDLNGWMPIGPGFQSQATSRCSTKAILAFVDEERLLRYFASRPHPATTERTITDFQPFLDHLLEVARQGYALDLAETKQDYCGVAAPFFTASGFPLGSFGIPIPARSFEQEREMLIEAVTHATTEASRALGYTGAYPPPSPLLKSRSASVLREREGP